MILTDFEHMDAYKNCHPLFPKAFQWLKENDLTTFPLGRVDIDGQDLFAIFEDSEGHDESKRRLESHREFIDIQVNFFGGERMLVTACEGLEVEDDFQPGGDLAFYKRPNRDLTQLRLFPQAVAIFFPEDAHMPSLKISEKPQRYRKLVMKVRIK
jgi:biofilm protein TabA